MRLVSNPKLIAPLCSILNGEPHIIQTQFYFTPPDRKGLVVHQDNYYVEAENDNFVSIWIPLVDTNKKNGGLYTFPGLHKKGLFPVEAVSQTLDQNDKRQALAEQTKLPSTAKSIDLTVEKEAQCFFGCNPHGSYKNLKRKQSCSMHIYQKGKQLRKGRGEQISNPSNVKSFLGLRSSSLVILQC